jgi:phosphoadenosine phosphosulfate reductase
VSAETPAGHAARVTSARDALRRAFVEHRDRLRIACSLGVEDVVVLAEAVDIARELELTPSVFMLDTGRLHDETYGFAESIEARFRLRLTVLSPDAEATARWVQTHGINGFYLSLAARRACCSVRKSEPLARALDGATAWVTGLRREQSPTRADVAAFERDERGLVKVSPLFDWSEADVWAHVRARALPTHPLHARGFPSIGCAPCTRAIAPGEHPRAGRWWWESPESKECGLHPRGAQ